MEEVSVGVKSNYEAQRLQLEIQQIRFTNHKRPRQSLLPILRMEQQHFVSNTKKMIPPNENGQQLIHRFITLFIFYTCFILFRVANVNVIFIFYCLFLLISFQISHLNTLCRDAGQLNCLNKCPMHRKYIIITTAGLDSSPDLWLFTALHHPISDHITCSYHTQLKETSLK